MKTLSWGRIRPQALSIFFCLGIFVSNTFADNVPPKCQITEPRTGQVFTNPERINIWATASSADGSVVSVEAFADGQSLGVITPNPASPSPVNPFDWVWENPPAGEHKLSALATAKDGTQGRSESIGITVKRDPPPPQATLVTQKPANGEVFTAPATVQIEVVATDPNGDIRHVEFFANDQFIGQSDHLTKDAVIPGRPRTHFFQWQNVAVGEYKIVAKAKDTLGNPVESDAIGIQVEDTNPDVPTVSIVASQPDTSEPSLTSRIAPGRFLVSRNGSNDRALTVFLAYGGSASLGEDYEKLPPSVTINAGEEAAELLVIAKMDDFAEDTESAIAKIVPPPAVTANVSGLPYRIDPEHGFATVNNKEK